jgi:hypothetical protein
VEQQPILHQVKGLRSERTTLERWLDEDPAQPADVLPQTGTTKERKPQADEVLNRST